jgi:shikimate kinase
MPADIVLIGPVRAGKSTLGKLLAEKLGLPQVSLDEVRYGYYKEIGYDENLARDIRRLEGFVAFMYYRELFTAYAVEKMLSDYHHCVFDFGAGIFESDEMFQRVQKALAGYPYVVLLLPSPNVEESARILAERDQNPPADLTFDLTTHFLRHHTYYDLAKFTLYTQGKSPLVSCNEILERLGLYPPSPGKK